MLRKRNERGDLIEVHRLMTGKESIEKAQFFRLSRCHYGLYEDTV
jgi:hypothetical protein